MERALLDRGSGSLARGETYPVEVELNEACEARRLRACGCEYHFECQGAQEQVHIEAPDMQQLQRHMAGALEHRAGMALGEVEKMGEGVHTRRTVVLLGGDYHDH